MTSPLSQPIKLGSLTLQNRIIMGSMHTALEYSSDPFGRLAAFYQERAKGGVGLIITGGVSPNKAGQMSPGAMVLESASQLPDFKRLTQAAHDFGAKIALQILHAGRYAKQDKLVAPSAIQSPINKFIPQALSHEDILETINDYTQCASLAKQAGFDGIEILGSEGYLLNEFTAEKTNKRTDQWGGDFTKRSRLPLAIIKAIRQSLGPDFYIQYRMSILELVDGGWTLDEAQQFAILLEDAGVDLINTGIGWHEATIPTIAMNVPRAAFSWATAKIKEVVTVPVAAANRINTINTAEAILERGDADMVYLSRPFLADPDFVVKAQQGRSDEINTCIACNQSCLDHLFENKIVSCLVNPRACHETFYPDTKPAEKAQKIAVIGAGPAGLAFSIEASKQGHDVCLFESSNQIGGQLLYAKEIPGKEEFNELLRYFQVMLKKHKVQLHLNAPIQANTFDASSFDHLVVATGIKPKKLSIPGIEHPMVLNYEDAFNAIETIGQTVLIIGAGGIAYDMAERLTHPASQKNNIQSFNQHWGIDTGNHQPGALSSQPPSTPNSNRQVTLLQRKPGKLGRTLGKTTGWIHQLELKKRHVNMLSDIRYLKIDEQGLHIERSGEKELLPADNIIICAGQDSNNPLIDTLQTDGINVHQIGGARSSTKLDAARAIKEAIDLAYTLNSMEN